MNNIIIPLFNVTYKTELPIEVIRSIVTPTSALSLARRWDGRMVGLAEKPATGQTWGWNTRHPIKVPHGAER